MKKPRTPTANGTSRLDVTSPGVNFLMKSDTVVLIMTGVAYTRHPWSGSADADIVSAFPCLSALFKKISTPSDRHRGMTFHPPWALYVLGLCRKTEL